MESYHEEIELLSDILENLNYLKRHVGEDKEEDKRRLWDLDTDIEYLGGLLDIRSIERKT